MGKKEKSTVTETLINTAIDKVGDFAIEKAKAQLQSKSDLVPDALEAKAEAALDKVKDVALEKAKTELNSFAKKKKADLVKTLVKSGVAVVVICAGGALLVKNRKSLLSLIKG